MQSKFTAVASQKTIENFQCAVLSDIGYSRHDEFSLSKTLMLHKIYYFAQLWFKQ